jgi:hypothetical protein
MREVSVREFRRLAGAENAEKVEEILDHAEWGAALYKTDSGMKFVVSFGNRFANLRGRYPPAAYGDSVLAEYVAAEPVEQEMVSPVFKALHDPDRFPQVHRPRSEPPVTRYPEMPWGR